MMVISEDERNDLANRFAHRALREGQSKRCQEISDAALTLATLIATNVPPCRKRSLALTKLEEAVMWATAGVASNE